MSSSSLKLVTKSSLDGAFERQLDHYIQSACMQPPTHPAAKMLLAAASARPDQQVVAQYAIGLHWLAWHYQPAWDWLQPALDHCAPYIHSVSYLQIQQQAVLLRHIAVFDQPRPQSQTVEQLLREAETIVYLKTGRWELVETTG